MGFNLWNEHEAKNFLWTYLKRLKDIFKKFLCCGSVRYLIFKFFTIFIELLSKLIG